MLMKIDTVLNNKIGIVGLGVLGSAIAECFVNKKIKIIGFDLSDKLYKKLNKSYFSSASSLDASSCLLEPLPDSKEWEMP